MKIHFIGIGGIGISALAKYYLYEGHEISGSDLSYPNVFSDEELSKIKFYLGHKADNLKNNVDLVIYTNAITKDNPELLKAKKLNIKTYSYPKALGELTKKYFTIAVSGMHGKSTTTAMIANLLIEANLDPLVIIGSKVNGFGPDGKPSNFRYGKGEILIIEADEYKAGFLNHYPDILIITNIEEEHLDYYKNLKNILRAFEKFIHRLNKKKKYKGSFSNLGKFLIVNRDNKTAYVLAKNLKIKNVKKIFYSLKEKPKKLKLSIPGIHNVSNSLAAYKVGKIFNLDDKKIFKALYEFKGIWRRLEFKGYLNGAKIFDDYGHHPTEIKATLQAAREILNKSGKLYLVFQPHQYYRTLLPFDKFKTAFDLADVLILTDIYSVAGREKESIKKKVNSEILLKAIKKPQNKFYIKDFNEIKKFLEANLKKGDICIIMGAGDIWKFFDELDLREI